VKYLDEKHKESDELSRKFKGMIGEFNKIYFKYLLIGREKQ